MFEASVPFSFFDYFRVPYRYADDGERVITGAEQVAIAGEAAVVAWPGEALLARESSSAGSYSVGSIPIFARVLANAQMEARVRRAAGAWKPAEAVRDAVGTAVSAVWRTDEGAAFLPFDPKEVLSNFWTERYVDVGPTRRFARSAGVMRSAYYAARPAMPRTVQIAMRRALVRLQKRISFPNWPVESAVDDFFRFMFELVTDAGGSPVPFIGVWPREWRWSLVLTHDIEGKTGYRNLERLLEIEVEHGYRSSWNFVPCNGYVVERSWLERLRADGFEIGVHGLMHDGRDVLPRTLPQRLAAIRSYADQWEAVGFRSPSTIRSPQLLPLLGFDYDSSFSDTTPFEPQPGGCCTWLPYMLDGTVELPITLVQDHTLFELLRHRDARLWLEKASLLRERGGMALMLTHPDYVSNPDLIESYRRFLSEFEADTTAWKALPRDVARWWLRRNASTLEQVDGSWRIVGPAAEDGRVEFATGGRRHV